MPSSSSAPVILIFWIRLLQILRFKWDFIDVHYIPLFQIPNTQIRVNCTAVSLQAKIYATDTMYTNTIANYIAVRMRGTLPPRPCMPSRRVQL
jgi:hypothetical protein